MSIGDQLSDEYEEYKGRSRTSAPFIYEDDGTLTLYFEMGSVQSQMYVNEPDLGRVPPGRSVLVYTDSNSAKPYHGRIGFVSPTAEFTPKNVETPELRTALVYRVRVVVMDADRALRQGMPVTVRLDTTSPAPPR